MTANAAANPRVALFLGSLRTQYQCELVTAIPKRVSRNLRVSSFPGQALLRHRDPHRAVIVTVPIMWMVQMRPDGVVDVIAMRDALMPAVGSVGVATGVLAALVRWSAFRRIRRSDRQAMLVHVVTVDIVEVAVVHVVGVTLVLDHRVPAAAAMRMSVLGMCLACHVPPPFPRGHWWNRGRIVVGLSSALGSLNNCVGSLLTAHP
jgi:hypothetical protein